MIVMFAAAAILFATLAVAGLLAITPIVNSCDIRAAARARAKALIECGLGAQASAMHVNAGLAFRETEAYEEREGHAHLLRIDGPFWNSWAGDAIQS